MSALTKLPEELYDPKAFGAFGGDRAFRLGTAKAMSWLCQLAYETDEFEKVARILAAWDLAFLGPGIIAKGVASPLPIARTEALLATRADVAFLSFAGTDPVVLEDWITDFRIRPSPGGLAQGFSTAAQAVVPEVTALLKASSSRAVLVSGHSLGGALAVIAALSLLEAGIPVAGVYTFGMPRTGSEAFQGAYDARLGAVTYRLVHGADIVPTVPPTGLDFRHVGRLLRCPSWAKFDPSALAPAPGSDEPHFLPQIAVGVRQALLRPLGAGALVAGAYRNAISLLRPGRHSRRNDAIGWFLDSLPPQIRDHLPDAYINAVT
ncbi:lipase family protein [Methylobacterium sp. D53M]